MRRSIISSLHQVGSEYMADEDLELSEVLIVGAIAGGGLLVLVVLGLFGSGQIDVSILPSNVNYIALGQYN